MDQKQHRKGFLITLFGVLVLTPDSVLVRLAGIDPMGLSFWRGLLQGTIILIFLLAIYKKDFIKNVKAIGFIGILVSIAFAICNISFVYSISNTHASNTLVILATTSMWAALLSLVILKEKVAPITLGAMSVSFIGVIIVVWDSLGSGNFLGDMMAVSSAVSMATAFTLIRLRPNVSMVPTAAVSALSVAFVAFFFMEPVNYEPAQWTAILIVGAIVLPISFGCMAVGPRYIPAAEVSLLLLLETTLGPIWVWLGVGEEPSQNAFIGGGIVISALFVHSIYKLKFSRSRTA